MIVSEDGIVISVKLPEIIDLIVQQLTLIIDDTSGATARVALLETGAEVFVADNVKAGDTVRIDTKRGQCAGLFN